MSAPRSPQRTDAEFATDFQYFGSSSNHHSRAAHHYDNMASLKSMGAENMDFELMQDLEGDHEMDQDFFNSPDDDFHMNMEMFQDHSMPNFDPSHGWQNSHLTSRGIGAGMPRQTQPMRRSALSTIVDSRERVVEQHGQITPPEEEKPDGFPESVLEELSESRRRQEEEDIAKQNRTQRARNAANKRHSKSKTARRDSSHDVESDGAEIAQGHGKSTNVQREKNRLAAAKCRAKKKATSEDMQEVHREGSKENNYLLREMRELRDQKAFLRNSLLQHEPGLCQCHAIHRFNFAQAQQLAMGVGAMIRQPLSPSEESGGSAITPGSDGSLGMRNEQPNHGGMPQRMSKSFNIGQMNCPGTYPAPAMSPDQSTPGQFADFLHSSPNGGRGGFA